MSVCICFYFKTVRALDCGGTLKGPFSFGNCVYKSLTSEYLLRKEIIVLLERERERESNCRLVQYDRSSSKILYYLLLHCAIADIFGHLCSLFVAFKE